MVYCKCIITLSLFCIQNFRSFFFLFWNILQFISFNMYRYMWLYLTTKYFHLHEIDYDFLCFNCFFKCDLHSGTYNQSPLVIWCFFLFCFCCCCFMSHSRIFHSYSDVTKCWRRASDFGLCSALVAIILHMGPHILCLIRKTGNWPAAIVILTHDLGIKSRACFQLSHAGPPVIWDHINMKTTYMGGTSKKIIQKPNVLLKGALAVLTSKNILIIFYFYNYYFMYTNK